MTSKEKAKELIENLFMFCPDSISQSKCAATIVCEEILKTKNFPATLHPDMVDFQNAYWRSVIEEINKYEE